MDCSTHWHCGVTLVAVWSVCLLVCVVQASVAPPTLPSPPAAAAQALFQDPRELCEAETFNPVCADSELVVVTEARYGRMQLGRCVRTDYGYVGCNSDVLEHLDGMCSGRRTCSLRIPDQALDATTACPREFKTYLNVSYECTHVESAACQGCSRHSVAKLTAPSGYIASVVTTETHTSTGCGSSKCPWHIEVQSGQTVNITLYDFALEQSASSGGSAAAPSYISPESCFRYAVIKEMPSHKAVPVCGGRGRSQVIYSSVTNQVEISVVSPEVFGQKGQFMFYYEAVGCADFEVPDRAVLKRYGDVVTVTCEDKTHSWQRKCVGTQWSGEIGTCPGSQGASTTPQGSNTLPLGVLIAIVLGIALVIGVLIVTVGVVCLKRQRSDYSRPYQPTYYMHGGGCDQYELQPDPQHQQLMMQPSLGPLPQPKFCGTLPPPKPPRPAGQQPARSSSVRGGSGPGGNVYGAPRMDQRPLPSLPNIPEATDAQCPCHVSSRPPAPRHQLSQPAGAPSPSRGEGAVCPQSAPVLGGSSVPMLACSVGPATSQHYTVLDPNEVLQLLATGGGATSQSPDPLMMAYGSSFQYLSSDDGTSTGSPTSAAPPQDSQPPGATGPPTAGSSSHEIPLRPARETSQPRIDSATGSGSSGNSWP